MKPDIHLMWPDGLAVWFFLRILNLGEVLGSIPSQALFLSPHLVSHVGVMFTNKQNRWGVVYNYWGRCLPFLELPASHVSTPINTASIRLRRPSGSWLPFLELPASHVSTPINTASIRLRRPSGSWFSSPPWPTNIVHSFQVQLDLRHHTPFSVHLSSSLYI